MKSVALFGGSFNPPHAGHAAILAYLVKHFNEVWLIPVVDHPFSKDLAPFEDRVAMLDTMVDKERRNIADISLSMLNTRGWKRAQRIEVVRREEKYTADMLDALRVENPDIDFTLVIGTDILAEVDKWHRWDDIKAATKLLRIARPGVEAPPESLAVTVDGNMDVSSTSIRERLALSDLTYLIGDGADLPSRVLEYIERKGLYGFRKPTFPKEGVFVRDVNLTQEEVSSLKPSVDYALHGAFRQILAVGQTETGIRFQVLVDTRKHREHYDDQRSWHQAQTYARRLKTPFTREPPQMMSPTFQMLTTGGEPAPNRITGRFLGQAGDMLFWTDDSGKSLSQWLFGL